MTERYRITIARAEYKFSCAHMTVFPDGTKERLHGHNYTLALALEVSSIALADMVPFSALKAALAALCSEWKEHVLLQATCPRLAIERDDAASIRFALCGQTYELPRADVLLLPLDNISVETLAMHAAHRLRAALALPPVVVALEATVDESPGQGASCRLVLT